MNMHITFLLKIEVVLHERESLHREFLIAEKLYIWAMERQLLRIGEIAYDLPDHKNEKRRRQ